MEIKFNKCCDDMVLSLITCAEHGENIRLWVECIFCRTKIFYQHNYLNIGDLGNYWNAKVPDKLALNTCCAEAIKSSEAPLMTGFDEEAFNNRNWFSYGTFKIADGLEVDIMLFDRTVFRSCQINIMSDRFGNRGAKSHIEFIWNPISMENVLIPPHEIYKIRKAIKE